MAAAVALVAMASCTRAEKAADSLYPVAPGVYGYIPPVVCEDAPGTKASTATSNMQLSFEVGDRINIWSDSGTLLIYTAQQVTSAGGALFDGGGFDLTDGKTYYSSFPLIANVRDDYTALSTSFEGQVQVADDDATHIPEYTYMYSAAVCEDNLTQFAYHYLNRFIRFELTLPKTMTVTELTITADSEVFALNGTANALTATEQATADFTPGEMSDTMTLGFDNVEVTDGVLNAYLSVYPYSACNVVVKVKDADGRVYASDVIAQADALTHGGYRTISTTLEDENPDIRWEKVTSTEQLTSGDFILVYPAGDTYKIFSYPKTIANAQEAADMVANMSTFAEVVPMRSTLFQKCAAGNYLAVAAPEDPAHIVLAKDVADEVAMTAVTTVGETANGSVLLKADLMDFNFSVVTIALAGDGAATITAQVNSTDTKNLFEALRGHTLEFAFTHVMDYLASELNMSANDKACVLAAYDKFAVVTKEFFEEHNRPAVDFDRNTPLMGLFETYYPEFAEISWGYDSDKAYGLIKPVGFYVEDDGFSGHIPMPSSAWFDRVAASFNYGEGGQAGFLAYWQRVDQEYPRVAQAVNRDSFFGRVAARLLDESGISDAEYEALSNVDWHALGQQYQTYVDELDTDPLADIFIYKKVE